MSTYYGIYNGEQRWPSNHYNVLRTVKGPTVLVYTCKSLQIVTSETQLKTRSNSKVQLLHVCHLRDKSLFLWLQKNTSK